MKIVLVMDQHYTSEAKARSTKLIPTLWATRYVEGLKRRGHEVTVIAPGEPDEGKVCVPEVKWPFFVKPIIEQQDAIFGVCDEKTVRAAFKGADIVHLEMPFKLCVNARKLADEMGIPCIASFHCQPENIAYNSGMKYLPLLPDILYRWMRRRIFDHVSHVHCPTEFIASELKKHRFKAKMDVVSNGTDAVFRVMDVEKPPEWKDKFVIIMVGRLNPEKRQDLIIKAVMRSKYADRIQLVLPGRGHRAKAYERLGRKLKNRPIFGFFGKEKLAELLNQCDLYVHAAEVEIEAVACVEAFSCGLVPVIADAPKSATRFFALDERCLFKKGSSKDLCSKIEYMIEHPEEKAKLRELYLEKAEEYRIPRIVEQMERVYETVIKEKKKGV